MQARSELEQGWRRILQIFRKWNRKKTADVETGGAPPLQKGRIHKPVIDKVIKQQLNDYFRQAFNEN
jgi:hypothetical protein